MNDPGGFATLLLAVITLATAAGVGFQRGKIAKLRGELAEADARAARIGDELTDTKTKLDQCRSDLDALGRVVTGEAHWTAISDQLGDHDKAAREHWTAQLSLLTKMAEVVEAYRR